MTFTAHVLPCILLVGMDVKRCIHQKAAQSQKFKPTTRFPLMLCHRPTDHPVSSQFEAVVHPGVQVTQHHIDV